MNDEQEQKEKEVDIVGNKVKDFKDTWKSMSKKDWIHTIMTYVMIILLCGTFYLIGYGKATAESITVANQVIVDLIDENNINLNYASNVYVDDYVFNASIGELVKIGEIK